MSSLDYLIPMFLEDTKEYIDYFEKELLKLAENADGPNAYNEVFRITHSLKSVSATLGFEKMSELSHHMEDLFLKCKSDTMSLNDEILSQLFKCVDILRAIHLSISKSKIMDVELYPTIDELILDIEVFIAESEENIETIEIEESKETSKETISEVAEALPEEISVETAKEIKGEINDESKTEAVEKTTKEMCMTCDNETTKLSTIRVEIEKIDKVLKLVGEFIVDKEILNQLGQNLKKSFKRDPDVKNLLEIIEHINSVGTEIQNTVMETRMLPLEIIFDRFPRAVKELSMKLDKKIDFSISGQSTELDRGIIEQLHDPLTHIIRNAIGHGFESKDERIKQGKDPIGKLKLSAKYEANHVVIEIEDDGRGIDIDNVKEKAITNGLISRESAESLSDDELLHYIFEPGFSTAKKVTELSGRGVGLDVVKLNINRLNGMVNIKTKLGAGTNFIVKLPLTLAIVSALLVKEDKYTFGLPLASVVEIIRLKGDVEVKKVHKIGNREVFNWRDQIIPVIWLGKSFGVDSPLSDNKRIVVIINYADQKYAFAVDQISGEQEIVIKSIGSYIGSGKLFGDMKGVVGVSILGNGSFAQIVDIGALIRMSTNSI